MDTSTNIPKVGDRIAVIHDCWLMGDPRALRTGNPKRHNAPVLVTAVVELTSDYPKWRVETTRCDGTPMHVYLLADGRDREELRASNLDRDVPPVRIVTEAVTA